MCKQYFFSVLDTEETQRMYRGDGSKRYIDRPTPRFLAGE